MSSSHGIRLPEIDEAQLAEIVRAQLAAGPAPPFEGPERPPVHRRWPPDTNPHDHSGRIHAADARLGLAGIPSKRAPRVNRSAKEGWRGRTYSFKARDVVPWNGRLVHAAIREADADAEVTALVGSPLTLVFETALGPRQRTAHLLLFRSGIPWLVDCHWEAVASHPGQEERWADIGRAAASIGIGYEVLTELHLEARVRAANVEIIHRSRCDDLPSREVLIAAIEGANGSGTSLHKLMEDARTSDRSLYRLILEGYLRVDLGVPLDKALVTRGPKAQ